MYVMLSPLMHSNVFKKLSCNDNVVSNDFYIAGQCQHLLVETHKHFTNKNFTMPRAFTT